MLVWNVLRAAHWKYWTPKIAICAPLHNFVGLYLRNYEQSQKNLLNNNISSTFPHNMVNFGPLTAEIGRRAWGTPGNFNGLASWLRYCTDVAQRKSTILCMMFSHLLGWYTIFGASCTLTEICHVQNWLCVQVLHSPTLASLLHDTQAVAGWSSRWASAHILVLFIIFNLDRL